ncbi:hypothetical protein EVAR_13816_1 [Eumeta japonica]|uniref:Uncharacterized protein n=1 Tax=Eumeta variegata TaxID=151549 RepID=A0A4C1U1E1_EUMVA|nr:hypothetical protein EVAR_13816_1 [Eumeta japonica]
MSRLSPSPTRPVTAGVTDYNPPLHPLYICKYNARSLLSHERLLESKQTMYINKQDTYDITGLVKIRRTGGRVVSRRYISSADEGPPMYAPPSDQNDWPEVGRYRAAAVDVLLDWRLDWYYRVGGSESAIWAMITAKVERMSPMQYKTPTKNTAQPIMS